MVIGSLAMLVATSPRLAAYTLVGIPLCVLPLVIGGRKLGRISRQSQDRVADANSLAAETLGAIPTVQAHAREPYERGRFSAAIDASVATAKRRIGVQALVTAMAISLVFGAITLVLWSDPEEHTSELQSLMRNSYAVFCLKKKTDRIKTIIKY